MVAVAGERRIPQTAYFPDGTPASILAEGVPRRARAVISCTVTGGDGEERQWTSGDPSGSGFSAGGEALLSRNASRRSSSTSSSGWARTPPSGDSPGGIRAPQLLAGRGGADRRQPRVYRGRKTAAGGLLPLGRVQALARASGPRPKAGALSGTGTAQAAKGGGPELWSLTHAP